MVHYSIDRAKKARNTEERIQRGARELEGTTVAEVPAADAGWWSKGIKRRARSRSGSVHVTLQLRRLPETNK